MISQVSVQAAEPDSAMVPTHEKTAPGWESRALANILMNVQATAFAMAILTELAEMFLQPVEVSVEASLYTLSMATSVLFAIDCRQVKQR